MVTGPLARPQTRRGQAESYKAVNYAPISGDGQQPGSCRSADQAESLSQPSNRLTGRHRTQPYVPDARPTLTCGYGLCRTGWTSCTDLRIRWRGRSVRAEPSLLIVDAVALVA